MADFIDNTQDYIDSRDVIARIAELEPDMVKREQATDNTKLTQEEHDRLWDDLHEEPEYQELLQLRALTEECKDHPEWPDGITLIRDGYFREHAQSVAEDIGAISSDFQWPLGHIDWEAAADALKMDYTEVDFEDAVYWMRG
jgi:hypothetical protein